MAHDASQPGTSVPDAAPADTPALPTRRERIVDAAKRRDRLTLQAEAACEDGFVDAELRRLVWCARARNSER